MQEVFICDKCREKVTGTAYYEGYSLCEMYYHCNNCGLTRSWAYGSTTPEDDDYILEMKDFLIKEMRENGMPETQILKISSSKHLLEKYYEEKNTTSMGPFS